MCTHHLTKVFLPRFVCWATWSERRPLWPVLGLSPDEILLAPITSLFVGPTEPHLITVERLTQRSA